MITAHSNSLQKEFRILIDAMKCQATKVGENEVHLLFCEIKNDSQTSLTREQIYKMMMSVTLNNKPVRVKDVRKSTMVVKNRACY